MPRRRTLSCLLASLLLLCAGGTGAQGRWYMVELLIFNNLDPAARTVEKWHPDPGLPDTSLAVPLGLGSDQVQVMGPSSYRLAGVWQVLRGSGEYRPLRHLAWRQVGTSASRAPLVQVGEDPSSNVFGTVKVTRSRFLHVELDLLVSDGEGSYRIKTRRKMSANQLHYIDHPLIGILARITRY